MHRGGPRLGRHPAGSLSPGDHIVIRYEDPENLWHVRLLLSHVSAAIWVILTPDGDLYLEDLGSDNGDIRAWRVFTPGGPSPYGVPADQIYDFRVRPDEVSLQRLLDEGGVHAANERARLGVPEPVLEMPAVPGGGADHGGGERRDIAGGGGGHAGLADVLLPAVQGGGEAVDDARTLAISRDEEGLRFKEFRVAVGECRQVEFPDWPVGGPRTTKHVLTEMLNHGGSAIAHHQAWRVACKFQPSDAPAVEHESWCKVLHTLLTYDQLDATNLAGVELVVRSIQRIEERHKHKLQATDDSGEASLFMGAMGGARLGSVVSPKLTEWVGSELQKEALIQKERRKAREERNLARKAAGDKRQE